MGETKFRPLTEDATDEQVDAAMDALKKIKIDKTPQYDEDKKKRLEHALKGFRRDSEKNE